MKFKAEIKSALKCTAKTSNYYKGENIYVYSQTRTFLFMKNEKPSNFECNLYA